MTTETKPSRLAVAAAMVLALAIPLLRPGEAHAAESLSVNLAAMTGAATSVGEGILYGVSQDGTEPPDQFVEPLGFTGMRGGGHAAGGGWIGDGYTYGRAPRPSGRGDRAGQALHRGALPRAVPGDPDRHLRRGRKPALRHDVAVRRRELRQLRQLPRRRGRRDPGVRGHGHLRHLERAGRVMFWAPGMDTTQYFEMWDTAVSQIRARPERLTVGPSLAADPAQNSERVESGSPTSSRPGRCQARSATTSRGTGTTRSPWPSPSTAT